MYQLLGQGWLKIKVVLHLPKIIILTAQILYETVALGNQKKLILMTEMPLKMSLRLSKD